MVIVMILVISGHPLWNVIRNVIEPNPLEIQFNLEKGAHIMM